MEGNWSYALIAPGRARQDRRGPFSGCWMASRVLPTSHGATHSTTEFVSTVTDQPPFIPLKQDGNSPNTLFTHIYLNLWGLLGALITFKNKMHREGISCFKIHKSDDVLSIYFFLSHTDTQIQKLQ